MKAILIFHVVAATLALLAGYAALLFRKGSGFHGAAGRMFVVSMLGMSASAVILAAFYSHVAISIVVGLLTFYLVLTAWRAVGRERPWFGHFDRLAAASAAGIGAMAMAFAADAALDPAGRRDGFPPLIYIVFGSIALLCAASDLRLLRNPERLRERRLVRHLFRMTFALLLASLSFYPGQEHLFPAWLRATNALLLPHAFVLGSMAWWIGRSRRWKVVPAARIAGEVG